MLRELMSDGDHRLRALHAARYSAVCVAQQETERRAIVEQFTADVKVTARVQELQASCSTHLVPMPRFCRDAAAACIVRAGGIVL
jgi:hypothetical protein